MRQSARSGDRGRGGRWLCLRRDLGSTAITVPLLGALSGTRKVDNTGVASCAKTTGGTQVGFERYWQTGALDIFDSKGCSERGF